MPLSIVGIGETRTISNVRGRDEQRRFLESLGFIDGAEVTVIAQMAGNLIVNIKESRVAIDRSMANRIMV